MTETTTQETAQEQQIDVQAMQAELERLRTHSAELLSDLKAERKAHNQTKSELQGALGGESATWKERYQIDVIDNALDAEIRHLAAVPPQYLKDICTKMGLLKLEPDAEGLIRPKWYGLDGEPAALKRGLYWHLSDIVGELHKKGPQDPQFLDLGRAMKYLGPSGGGATGGTGRGYSTVTQPPEKPQNDTPPQYGIR